MATRSLGTLTLDLLMKIGGYIAPMDQAARKTKKSTDDMKKDFNGVKLAVVALGAASNIAFAAMAKASINSADDLSKVSQQAAYTVEGLSALKFTAGLAGVEFEGLSASLIKFNKNIANVSEGGAGPAADAFSDLNIELIGVDGQLKSTEDLFYDVADALSVMEDGAKKTALAQDLLGKSGSQLIPLLNGGADGLREGAEEAKRLGQVIGSDAAKAAEQFNDNLSRLKASVTGVSNTVAMELVPYMAEFTNLLADPNTQQGIAAFAKGMADIAGASISAVASLGKFYNIVAGEQDNVDKLEYRLESLKSLIGQPNWWVGLVTDGAAKNQQQLNEQIGITESLLKGIRSESELMAELDAFGWEKAFGSIGVANKQLSELELMLDDFDWSLDGAVGENLIAGIVKVRDEYESVIASMEKQIALYGNTTRVAEVRYDLEHGYLQGINDLQKQNYINLAKQLDLLDQQRDLMAELDEFDWSLAPADPGETEKTVKFMEDAAERVNESFSNAWMNIEDGWEGLRDGIVDGFKRMLAEMAHEAVTKPIVLNIQQSMTGGGTSAGQGAGNALGAIGAGGVYAAIALAVVAGVSVWNKSQEEKFAKMTAEYRQATQSMGTVLGEANKKSESIANGIDYLTKISDDTLGVSHQMLTALQDIRLGIAGMSAGFARQFGISGGGDISNIDTGTSTLNWRAMGVNPSNLIVEKLFPSDTLNDLFVGFTSEINEEVSKAIYNKKIKIKDSGIKILGQDLADILESGMVEAFAYADVNVKKKTLGITTSNKMKERLSELDDALLTQFGGVFTSAAEALEMASGVFGVEFDKYIEKLKIDPQKLSLKGLEGDELTAEIEAFFSSTLDGWAEVLIGGTDALKKFQEVGEGAFETMIRLAGETSVFTEVADRLGFNFNVVGIAAVEAVQYLADAAGGFDNLSKSLSNYANKFLSDAEQVAFATKIVNEEFGKLGISVPKTREEFSALVQGLDLTTEAGRAQFTTLMGLVDVTDSYITALDKETKAKEEAAKAAVGSAFDSLNRAVQAERDLIDKMNQDAMDAIQKSLTEHQAVANSLSSALNSMSIESAKADLLTRRAAQAQLITANAIAKAGGPLPSAGQLDSALDVLARPSQELFATFEEYARDFYVTQKNMRELQEAAVGQVSIDEQNLKAQEAYHAAELDRLDKLVDYYQAQIDVLNNIDNSVLSVEDAIEKLNLALSGVGVNAAAPVALVASQQSQALIPIKKSVPLLDVTSVEPSSGSRVAFDVVSELKALRTELENSQYSIAKNTLETRKILERWDGDGLPQEREEEVS